MGGKRYHRVFKDVGLVLYYEINDFCVLFFLSKAIVLTGKLLCLCRVGDIWPCLERFWVVTMGDG